MGEGNEIIRMRFVSELVFIDIVQGVVQKVLEKLRVVEDEIFWMSLSVREAVINSIKHGNRFDKNKYVEFVMTINSDHFRAVVSDQGDGFDATGVPNPLAEENLLKPSGRGIFYIRSFMDQVIFQKTDAGMMVIMEKKFTLQK